MPSIKVNVEHKLKQIEATARVKNLLNKLKEDYGNMVQDLKEDWNGNDAVFSFKSMGMSVSGTLNVNENGLKVDGKIPLAAIAFKSTIENKIKEEALKLLV